MVDGVARRGEDFRFEIGNFKKSGMLNLVPPSEINSFRRFPNSGLRYYRALPSLPGASLVFLRNGDSRSSAVDPGAGEGTSTAFGISGGIFGDLVGLDWGLSRLRRSKRKKNIMSDDHERNEKNLNDDGLNKNVI